MMIRIFILSVSVMISSTISVTASPADLSCKLTEAFKVNKKDAKSAIRDIYNSQFMNENTLQLITNHLDALPDQIQDSSVLEIANAGDLVVEHLITLIQPGVESVYIRIIYEKHGKNYIGVKFRMDDSLDDSLAVWPMLQEPVNIRC